MDADTANALVRIAARLEDLGSQVRGLEGELGRINGPASRRVSQMVVTLRDLVAAEAPADWTLAGTS